MIFKHKETGHKVEVLSDRFFLNTISESSSVHQLFNNGLPFDVIFICDILVQNLSKYGGPVVFYKSETVHYLRPTFEFIEMYEVEQPVNQDVIQNVVQ